MRNKTRILVTTILLVLPKTDKIIVLKEGKISEMRTYRELLARKQYFAQLIEQYSSNNKSEVEDEDEERKRSESKANNDIQNSWPFNGNIKFNEYSTKYRTGLDLVLKQISFDISPGEKVIKMFNFFETIIYMFSDVFIDRNSRQNRCR